MPEPLTPPAPATVPGPEPAFARILGRLAVALSYPNFRKLWFGACTSSIGTWMQSVAQSWLVLDLTKSTFFLGLDAFLGQVPIMLFTLIGGVIADRHDRRRILLTSQYVQMSTAFILAALVYFRVVHIGFVLALSFVTGCAQAFGGPAHQSLMPSLVDKQHLPNAIALNSIQFNLARVLGPLLAGLALASLGTVFCFTANGFSFLAVIAALLLLQVPERAPQAAQRPMAQLRGGLSYVKHDPTLVSLTVLAFASTFFGTPVLTLLPAFVRNVFHLGVGDYSRMMVFSGAGAVGGAIVVAWLGRFEKMARASLLMQLLFGALTLAFAASRHLLLSELLLFLCGAALVIVYSLMISLVQLTAPNELRGRVMSIYMVAFRGGMPLGSLASGWVANVTSEPTALLVNGVAIIAVAGIFLRVLGDHIGPRG